MKSRTLIFTGLIALLVFSDKLSAQIQCKSVNRYYCSLPVKYQAEPFGDGSKPKFAIRGIKGNAWTPQQYLKEIPLLSQYKADFLMNSYLSMFSENYNQGNSFISFPEPPENNWRNPLSDKRKEEWENVIRECKKNSIEFCFSMNPQSFTDSPLQEDSESDFGILWLHYNWAQSNGVKWFSLCLDNVDKTKVTVSGESQAKLANRLLAKLREKDKDAQLILCPTIYWGTGADDNQKKYFETLSKNLDKDIYLFWAGPQEFSRKITFTDAETFKKLINHRIILWDNYPANGNNPAMNLGPLTGRSNDLYKAIDGYMSGSMSGENEINNIPMLTSLHYAYNPTEYNPSRSVGQAILHLTSDNKQGNILIRMVENYPGYLILQPETDKAVEPGQNPVREDLSRMIADKNSVDVIEKYIAEYDSLAKEFNAAFPESFSTAKDLINGDVLWMKKTFGENRSALPEKAAPLPFNIISYKKIWDNAPHNAFTDLIRFHGMWYCTFRESETHAGTNGKIRVIKSRDGNKWESAALFEKEGIDLRDPHFAITPDKKLMLHIGASVFKDGRFVRFNPSVTFSEDGRRWSEMADVNFSDKWPWHPYCNGKEFYLWAYGNGVSLEKSSDGMKYDKVYDLNMDGNPNEIALCQTKDTLVALMRRDNENKHAFIGKAVPPYNNWKWTECNIYIGGPSLLVLPDGRIMGSSRCFVNDQEKTMLGILSGNGYEPVLILPGGGDCSYPGMALCKNEIWITYYSSHEDKTSIYLVRVKINSSKNIKNK